MKRLLKLGILFLILVPVILSGCEDEDSDVNTELTYYEIFEIINDNAKATKNNYLVNAEIITTIYRSDESNPSEILSISYTNKYDGTNLYIYEQTISASKDENGKDVTSTMLVENTYYNNKRYVNYVSNIGDQFEAEETVVENQEVPLNNLVQLELPLTENLFLNATYSNENGKNVIIIPASTKVCAIITSTMLPSLKLGINENATSYEGSLQYIYDDSYNFIGLILNTHIHLNDDSHLAYDYSFKLELKQFGNVLVEDPETK